MEADIAKVKANNSIVSAYEAVVSGSLSWFSLAYESDLSTDLCIGSYGVEGIEELKHTLAAGQLPVCIRKCRWTGHVHHLGTDRAPSNTIEHHRAPSSTIDASASVLAHQYYIGHGPIKDSLSRYFVQATMIRRGQAMVTASILGQVFPKPDIQLTATAKVEITQFQRNEIGFRVRLSPSRDMMAEGSGASVMISATSSSPASVTDCSAPLTRRSSSYNPSRSSVTTQQRIKEAQKRMQDDQNEVVRSKSRQERMMMEQRRMEECRMYQKLIRSLEAQERAEIDELKANFCRSSQNMVAVPWDRGSRSDDAKRLTPVPYDEQKPELSCWIHHQAPWQDDLEETMGCWRSNGACLIRRSARGVFDTSAAPPVAQIDLTSAKISIATPDTAIPESIKVITDPGTARSQEHYFYFESQKDKVNAIAIFEIFANGQ
ncbi:uncharacterized protein BJ171DRAFT_476008 [Polychytrium aggregatum]|uniref:uncharacterized protein n=1 Tax=Polychytrium aggregatum TaxID=110093 RepID=UPI0022FDF3D6|nr:uncharacterized protein BJ171DRAFT_476008 [Polychytrium aggregatum]KAI9203367.1 hypothetical protein BJ171DRAFT_476008 [Polychytrium aggregatum]